MRAAAATAGMLTVLMAPACDRPAAEAPDEGQALRRAAYRAFAARHRLAACGVAEARADARLQLDRFEELQAFARRKGAGHALWLGENDWHAVRPRAGAPDCAAPLPAFRAALDALGEEIAAW
ncbi:MAG: hypothetical protein ACK4K7_06455 [Allosphingosinicella sp.]|uniref:hypothetical protein n=1 Tax=Allosphingosinicella sp. TaxID=2823234 RepID=UPI003935BC7C